MKTILAFGASNSLNSINKEFAVFAANQFTEAKKVILDLNDFEMPIYSIDREKKSGIHELAYRFKEEIRKADGIIISFAEHNGAYSAAFKNIFDWVSRFGGDVWEGKPMFLLSTAPGSHGGKTVLEIAYNRFSRRNKNTLVTFSLPEFEQNFDKEKGIINPGYLLNFKQGLSAFKNALVSNESVKVR